MMSLALSCPAIFICIGRGWVNIVTRTRSYRLGGEHVAHATTLLNMLSDGVGTRCSSTWWPPLTSGSRHHEACSRQTLIAGVESRDHDRLRCEGNDPPGSGRSLGMRVHPCRSRVWTDPGPITLSLIVTSAASGEQRSKCTLAHAQRRDTKANRAEQQKPDGGSRCVPNRRTGHSTDAGVWKI
jgi:hypothetical protein